MAKYMLAFTFLALIIVSSKIVGGFSLPVLNAGSLALAMTFVSAAISRQALAQLKARQVIAGALIVVVLLLVFTLPLQGYFARLLALIILAFLIGRFVDKPNFQAASLCWVLGVTAFLTLVLASVYVNEPIVWTGVQYFVRGSSRMLGRMTNQPILMSTTASGLMISIVFLLFGLVATLMAAQQRWLRFLGYAVAIVLSNAIFIGFVHWAAQSLQTILADIEVHPMNALFILVLLDGLPLYWFVRKLDLKEVSFAVVPTRWFPVTLGAFVFVVILATWRLSFTNQPSLSRNVLVYERGYFTWDKPAFERYGLRAGGMFGMLPEYLNAMGHQVKKDSLLSQSNLDSAKIVVVINLNQMIPEDEKLRLRKFIYDGGSLLVMGDHTGLGGIMEPLNDLLDFVKVRYRFDSAHYLKKDWRDAFEFIPHPIFKNVKDEIDVGVSVGASLAFSPVCGRPLLFGKYGFSDWGDVSNSHDAYLGDRRYNPGELLGDITLLVEAQYGKGKVLVFGDTSTFQNGTLAYSYQFVQNIFEYLSAKSTTWSGLLRRIAWPVSLLIGLVVALYFGKGLSDASIIAWIAMCVLGVSVYSSMQSERKSTSIENSVRVAYVDASHLNRFSQYSDDGIWALVYHLMRNNYLPIVAREFSPAVLRQSSVAFFVSPARSIDTRINEVVDAYVKGGGVAIWSLGYEEREPVKDVLAKYGFDLENIPLGPIPLKETGDLARFGKAWPVKVSSSGDIDTLCTGWNYPVIVSRNVGSGKFVLVGDPKFFLSENLELNHSVKKSNDLFLKIISRGTEGKTD